MPRIIDLKSLKKYHEDQRDIALDEATRLESRLNLFEAGSINWFADVKCVVIHKQAALDHQNAIKILEVLDVINS